MRSYFLQIILEPVQLVVIIFVIVCSFPFYSVHFKKLSLWRYWLTNSRCPTSASILRTTSLFRLLFGLVNCKRQFQYPIGQHHILNFFNCFSSDLNWTCGKHSVTRAYTTKRYSKIPLFTIETDDAKSRWCLSSLFLFWVIFLPQKELHDKHTKSLLSFFEKSQAVFCFEWLSSTLIIPECSQFYCS